LHPEAATFLYRKAYTTYALAVINILVFMWMISHGLAGAERIYRATAVSIPQDLTSIHWWQLFAANFVHRNTSHIVVNLLLLIMIGPFVEFVMGIKKYLVVYLIAGVGALFMDLVYAKLFDLYVPSLRVEVLQLVAGASSAVFGIVGARGAIFLFKWLRERSTLARNHFFFMFLLVWLQVGADLMNFNVAFGAHLTGAIIGFILGLVFGRIPFNVTDANPVSLVGASKSSR
jgi:membrane associated rhomboid family serine protease